MSAESPESHLNVEKPPSERQPTTLFKFSSYTGAKGDRVDTLFASGELWFSTANSFNDPFDSRPYFEPVYPDDPARSTKVMKEWLGKRLSERGANRQQRRAVQGGFDPRQFREKVDAYGEQFYSTRAQEVMICSMCRSMDSLLLWSHYAN